MGDHLRPFRPVSVTHACKSTLVFCVLMRPNRLWLDMCKRSKSVCLSLCVYGCVAVDLCSLCEAICHLQLERRRVQRKVHMRDGGQRNAVTRSFMTQDIISQQSHVLSRQSSKDSIDNTAAEATRTLTAPSQMFTPSPCTAVYFTCLFSEQTRHLNTYLSSPPLLNVSRPYYDRSASPHTCTALATFRRRPERRRH